MESTTTPLTRTMLRAAVTAALALATTPVIARDHSLVPVDVQPSTAPAPVQGGGRTHLLYELRLSNFAPRDMVLEEVDVSDGDTVLASFAGEPLAAMLTRPGIATDGAPPAALAPGGFGVLFVGLELPEGASTPGSLTHRLRFRAPRPDAEASRTTIEGIPVAPSSAAAVAVVGAPLRGAGWVAANGLSNDADHRRTLAVVDGQARIAQRYAIDFVRLDRRGRAFTGDPSRNRNWAGYGAPVLAVADGIVDAVHDGMPDNTPGQPPTAKVTLDTISGNSVALDIGDGRHVLYGHLAPGSITVATGERVRKGRVIGRLGNSGQSDAPHLHIHVADAASPLGADGMPYAFDRFASQGYVPSLAILEDPDGWQPQRATPTIARTASLPVANEVVDFGP